MYVLRTKTNKMTLIGLIGLIGSGKDTFANELCSSYGYIKLSFASCLKDVVSQLFVWNRSLLEGDTEESRAWRNKVDDWWSQKLGIPSFTPRLALQLIGTDVFRNHFHKNIWVICMERILDNFMKTNQNVVVTDCRFANEVDLVKKLGGHILRIDRHKPSWWVDHSDLSEHLWAHQMSITHPQVHESEWRVVLFQPDKVISNIGSIESLQEQAKQWVQSL